MKILVINKWLVTGGLERVLLSYLTIFKQLGYEIDLVLTYNVAFQDKHFQSCIPEEIQPKFIFSDLESQKKQLLKENKHKSLWAKIRYELDKFNTLKRKSTYIQQCLKSTSYDLVIDFSLELPKALVKQIAKQRPIIGWQHNQLYHSENMPNKIKHKYQQRYHLYSKVIMICEAMRTQISNQLQIKQTKLATIYNPIAVENIEQKANQLINLDNYFLLVSRLVKGKGILELIEIYAHLVKKGIHYKLAIIGDGELKNDISAAIKKLHLQDKCLLLGEITNPYPYFKQAKLFLFTSESEGLGMVLLESMALGVPVVAMDCPTGPKEILGENSEFGKLIPMHNQAMFIDAVLELLNNPERWQHYAQQSLIRIQDFSSEKIASQVDRLFKQVIAEHQK